MAKKSKAQKDREEAQRTRDMSDHWLLVYEPWYQNYRPGTEYYSKDDLNEINWWLCVCLGRRWGEVSAIQHMKARNFIIAKVNLTIDEKTVEAKLGRYLWKDFLLPSGFPRQINPQDRDRLYTKVLKYDYIKYGDPCEQGSWNEYMTAPGSPPRGWPVDPNAVFRPIWCSPPNSQESKIWCIPIPRPQEILQQDLAARTRPGESQAAVDGVVYREDLDVNRPPSNSQRQARNPSPPSQSRSPPRLNASPPQPRSPSYEPNLTLTDRPPIYDPLPRGLPVPQLGGPSMSSRNQSTSSTFRAYQPYYHGGVNPPSTAKQEFVEERPNPLQNNRGEFAKSEAKDQTALRRPAHMSLGNGTSVEDLKHGYLQGGQENPPNLRNTPLKRETRDVHSNNPVADNPIKSDHSEASPSIQYPKTEVKGEGDEKKVKSSGELSDEAVGDSGQIIGLVNPCGVEWGCSGAPPEIESLFWDWLQYIADGAVNVYCALDRTSDRIYVRLNSYVDLKGILGIHSWKKVLVTCPDKWAYAQTTILLCEQENIEDILYGLFEVAVPEPKEDLDYSTMFQVPYPPPDPLSVSNNSSEQKLEEISLGLLKNDEQQTDPGMSRSGSNKRPSTSLEHVEVNKRMKAENM